MKHLVSAMPLLPCCQVWEVFLVRRLLSEAVLYPVAAIEPVLSLTCLSLALIYLHTCLRSTLTFIDIIYCTLQHCPQGGEVHRPGAAVWLPHVLAGQPAVPPGLLPQRGAGGQARQAGHHRNLHPGPG